MRCNIIDKTKNLEKYIFEQLEELKPYVDMDSDERPHDLMDCGMYDGTWNTYIEILDFLKIPHENYEKIE